MFYEQLNNLCKERKTTITAFTTQVLKLSSSKVTAWKSGSIPKYRILEEIAEYFEVTIGELFDGKRENLTLNEKEIIKAFRKLSEREQLKVIFKLELIADQEEEAKTKEAESSKKIDL